MSIRNGWERDVLDRLVTLVETRDPPQAGRIARIPMDHYRSRERLALERRHVFERFPLIVGFSAQVREPGSFLTHDPSGVPILVTRDASGTLRAFLNVCRHRGAKLAGEPCGSGRSILACRYHGWRYALDGTLRAVPGLKGFPDLKREERGLVSLPVSERHGLVFVRVTPGPELELERFLGPVFEELETFGFPRRVVFESSVRTVACNWKLMIDTVLEAYHISVLHRKTGGLAFEENQVLFDASTPPNGRFVLPLRGLTRPEGEVAEGSLLHYASPLYWMFPNSVILFSGSFAHMLSVFPVDEGRCTVQGSSLRLEGPLDEAAQEGLQKEYEQYWATIREDISVTETIQEGMASGANQEFLFGGFESVADTHFHSALEAALQGRLTP
ncbi:aromatic ring-hydroxylating oxygenase subunit alpha [Stigmatella aurantiaca]|uniref:Rieske [2Fe-2S] domain protein n=1 Tax=Stigmatella aurantiaca (strain DW4/3-1) TaxID=378806 RepID=Q096C1_STIAD|nr:aromatic ring-hydroxylating dioxygenase subunit alpha [Stigmatella aurantiaca]ADO69493.1 Rieske [2Fe-2S] domain protein [Stigmatella aurantiaca DW4/3-1]EAU67596.1 rieske [2Fe-2S] domain protein [Stigmatella aurantiaca DW4/3-1]